MAAQDRIQGWNERGLDRAAGDGECRIGQPKKKGAVRVSRRPKSREETPKEGSDTATPIAMSQCTNSRVHCQKSSVTFVAVWYTRLTY